MEPRRIALIKPSALGDIVHALPVLSALRRRFPDSRITWVVNKSYEPLLAGHPDLTDTLAFDRGAFKKGVRHAVAYSLRFAAELRRRRFDLVIDLQGLLRTGLMCLATGAARRVGFANSREGSRHAYTKKVRVPDADRIHAVDRYWRVAEALGAGDGPKRFHVPLQPAEVEWARSELADLPRPCVAVAVGARWLTKRWPPAHFAALLKPLAASLIFVGTAEDTALTKEVMRDLTPQPPADLTPRPPSDLTPRPPSRGGKGEEKEPNPPAPFPPREGGDSSSPPRLGEGLGERLSSSPPRFGEGAGERYMVDLTGRTTLPRLAALLSLCDVMVANDTGPLHLAAALGRPCVAPYTCTRVALHGPYGSMAGGVETSVPCAGSYLKTCDKLICMPDLTPDRLRGRLAEVLEPWSRTSRSA